MIEFVDHLHEHFLEPVRMVKGCYQCPKVRISIQYSHLCYQENTHLSKEIDNLVDKYSIDAHTVNYVVPRPPSMNRLKEALLL